MSKSITLASDQESRNACRFCCSGTAAHKVADETKAETFYLCDRHCKEYQADQDDIQSNIDTRAKIAARKAAAEKEASPSPAEKVEVQ